MRSGGVEWVMRGDLASLVSKSNRGVGEFGARRGVWGRGEPGMVEVEVEVEG